MSKVNYEKRLVHELLVRAYKRKQGSNKRPSVSPEIFCPGYYDNNFSIREKSLFNEAAERLEAAGLVTIERDRGGYNISKVRVDLNSLEALEAFSAERYGLRVRGEAESILEDFERSYSGIEPMIDEHLKQISDKAFTSPQTIDFDEERRLLDAAGFLSKNISSRGLYVREASELIYGESKALEKRLKAICKILGVESLAELGIMSTDDMIQLRGNIVVYAGGSATDYSEFSKGFGFYREDIASLERI